MNAFLVVGGTLAVFLGLAHSVLGEKFLLCPLFKRREMPKLLGSALFAKRTFRFAWHLTTVLLAGIGMLVVALSGSELESQTAWILRVFSLMFAVCGFASLIGTRGKHFSWLVFLIIAATIWIGAS